MASIFRKITSEIARPFTRDLRALIEKNQNHEIKALLIEHSRSMADNMELLCSLQTALCEKVEALAKTQNERMDALAVLQNSDSNKLDISLRRFVFALDSQRALVRTTVGYMVCDRQDALVLAQLVEAGDLEPGLRRFMERYLEEGMTFVDVGAHIGMHTIAAARCVGRKGKVHAFEATPATADCLRENVIQNNLEFQISVHAQFVGASAGWTTFHMCPINGHNSRFPLLNETSTIEVPVVTLDETLADVPSADLIKVDVEGAELDVFAGMNQLLERSPDACVVAEFAPSHLKRSGTNATNWEEFCRQHGFEMFIVEEPRGTLRPVAIQDLMSLETANVLMARGKTFQHAL